MAQSDEKSFGYVLVDVTRLFRKHFDRRAVPLGLTRSQWRALKAIGHKEGMSQTELADFLEMEPIPVGRVIDRLQDSGFVERRADPTDRRRWRLYVTEKAHGVIDSMEDISRELRRESQRGIKSADMQTMIDVLNKMKENLQALDAAGS
jgi:MarR family transcriptional regulator for hemolysin